MILVTGGAGVMGSTLVRGLAEKGAKVRILDLPGVSLNHLHGLDVDVRFGDISDAASLRDAFDQVDTVFHLAAVVLTFDPSVYQRVNVQGTRNILEGAAAAGVGHFIYVSSASVVYPKPTPYSLSKRECEKLVRSQTATHCTIVRPTLVYSGNGGEEFDIFAEYLKRYPVVPFIGNGRALKNPVHVDDLMRGFLAIPGNPGSYGKTYNFSGGEEISIGNLARLIMKHQRFSKPIVRIPVPVCRLLAAAMGLVMKRPPLRWNVIAGMTQDANLDNSSARADLGYDPIGVHDGFQRIWPL